MLLKGTLRSWDVEQWTADVQIAGSLGSYLSGVPLAAAIPVWELVAGRTVLVAVPDAQHPGDAYVVAIAGAPVGPPRCRVYHSVPQTIPHDAITYLAFDSERIDSHGLHDPTTNNSRLTIPLSGVYAGAGTIRFPINGTGVRVAGFSVNRGNHLALQRVHGDSTTSVDVNVSFPPYRFAAGDYVEFWAYQNSGVSLSTSIVAASSVECGIWMIGT